jgi:glycosyltransferase involved in cell wall biosynthesis
VRAPATAVKILVDGAIVKPELGGIATYIAGVASGLAVAPGVTVTVVTSVPELFDATAVELVSLPPSVRHIGARVRWRERALKRLIEEHHCDVLLAPTVELPARRLGVPSIVVIHDLGAIQERALYGWGQWLRYTLRTGAACRRADHIVCVSNATLAQLRASIGQTTAPCSVVGEAGRELPLLARARETPPYVLSVGAMRKHKNIETLVRAMDRAELAGVALKLAGPLSAGERERFDGWRAELAHPERVEHHGFVDAAALARLYAGAAVVALPSLFEGFGLSMLEAMRAGVPVVASSIPALVELGGPCAVYVDEHLSSAAWARAIASVIADDALAGRLERDGPARVASASWLEIGARLAAIARGLVAS